ncbi:MAG TPA: alcohol dehydrogenase catalytic domain-containing protein, partial [Myxococcales bacterium]|nr:alcohol dehydrogenase catalytic domain-containing protein [Myxococcales bacterium]
MPELGRAAVFTEVRKPFQLREFPLPAPEAGGLLVAISLTNVCGSDLHIWRGDTDLARMGLTYPIILGHEMVGRIAAVGKGGDQDALGRSLREG